MPLFTKHYFVALKWPTSTDGCPTLTNEPYDPRFPNITLSFDESEIENEARYDCPCQDFFRLIEGENNHGARRCGGTYTYGAKWDPVKITEECGYTSITLQLCQIALVRKIYQHSYTSLASSICVISLTGVSK